MSTKFTSTVETVEPTKLKITIQITPEAFKEGLTKAYNKNKQYFNVQGFRKGRAPRKLIEKMYGREVFYEDAMNAILPEAYDFALDEHDLEPVYRPEIEPGPASEEAGAIFHATIYIRPVAEIEGYHGLLYPKADAEPTEEDIDAAIKQEQEKSATQESVNRPAELGDIVTIDYEGFFGDEAFEGGKGSDHPLTLGAGQFIPGFEEQLVGHIPGDDVTVTVNFPDDYHHPDYSGKEARFEVEVLDVQAKVLPAVDDEFASNVSEFDTLAEYRADLSEKIKKSKEQNLENVKRGHIMRQLTDKVTVDIPEAMYLARLDELQDEFSRYIQGQGMDMETYMRFTQLTPEALRANWRPQAEAEVKNMVTLEAVAIKEGIEISDTEFEERFTQMFAPTAPDATEEVKAAAETQAKAIIATLPPFRRKEITRSFACDKAMAFVIENAVETDEPLPEFAATSEEASAE